MKFIWIPVKNLKFENFILIKNIIKSKEKLKLKLKYISNMKLHIRYYIQLESKQIILLYIINLMINIIIVFT